MRMKWASRAVGLVLALFVLALVGGGCGKPQPKPQEAAAALKNAQKLEEERRLEDAMREYANAAQLDAEGATAPEALYKWGALAMRTNKPDQAVQAYTALNAYYPPNQPRPEPTFLEQILGSQKHPPITVETSAGPIRIPEDSEKLLDQAHRAQDKINSGNITYKVMDFLVRLTGKHPVYSYWIGILIFTLVLKVVMTPLTVNQLRSSRKMMLIQPKLKEIQDKFREQPEELNRRMLALYKEEGVNPLGCGSGMILQMVIMFMLYKVILDYQYQFHNAQFLWINPALGEKFPQFIGANLAKPDIPLLLIYAISMFVQSRLTMVPTLDPQQAQQQKMMATMMPFMLLIVLRSFPSAFALYWLLFNVFSTIQMLHINKQLDMEMGARQASIGSGDEPPDNSSNGKGGGASKPTPPPLKKGPSGGTKKNPRRK